VYFCGFGWMVKHLKKVVRVFLAVATILCAGVALWLHTGPRDFSWLKPIIVEEFSKIAPGYTIDIAHVDVYWRDIARLGVIRIDELRVNDMEGNVFALFPEIELKLSPWRLLVGSDAVDRVRIYRPLLLMTREEDGQIKLGLKQENASLSLAGLLATVSGQEDAASRSAIPFSSLEIKQAQFLLRDVKTNSQISSEDFEFGLEREGEAYSVRFRLPVRTGTQESLAEGSARRIPDTSDWALNMHLDAWSLDWVCKFANCNPENDVTGLASGQISAVASDAFALDSISSVLELKDLKVTLPSWFEKPLSVPTASVKVGVDQSLSHVKVEWLKAQLAKDAAIEASADLRYADATGWTGEAKGNTANVKSSAVRKYWPVNLAPQAREWSIKNLTKGIAKKADIALSFKPGYTLQEVLPDEAMLANVEVEGVNVHFLPGFPDLMSFDGSVIFTGQTMNVVTKHVATAAGSVLENLSLSAPDLNHPNTPIETTFDFDAVASDVANVLKLKYFTFDDAVTLNPKTISGKFKGKAEISFNAYSGKTTNQEEIDFSSVKYDLTAKIMDAAQAQLNASLDVANLNADLHVANGVFKAKGGAKLSGHTLDFEASQQDGGDVMLAAKGSIARKDFVSLGLPDTHYITAGAIGVDAEAIAKKDRLVLKRATLDLRQSVWDAPEISWSKPEKLAGKITVIASSGQHYKVDANSQDLRASGTMELGGKSGMEVVSASFPRIQSNLNDFGFSYAVQADGYSIGLTGTRLDASASYAKQENNLLQDFPPLRLSVNLGELVLAQKAALYELKGSLNCNQKRCESADIHGKANGANFTATIGYEAGARKLHIKADNAGEFIRAFDISDRVFDGKLSLTGTYQDGQTPAPLNARLTITDFTLKNSQILGRILSIGSLTGLANALTGSGIAIEKMGADIEALKGRVLVKKGKANGNAMGFTIEGVVDTATSELHMKGVLVPAFFINSVVNSIPLIGTLAGGEGEGLIAFRYTIDGKYSDPDTTVNPLSGLTPGFLRGIFGVFDSPKPKIEREGEPKPEPVIPPPAK